jgi:hypothetical protein
MLSEYLPNLKQEIESFDLETVFHDIKTFGTYEKIPLRNFTKQMYLYIDSQFATTIDHQRLAMILARLESYVANIAEDDLLYIIHTLDRIRQCFFKNYKEESSNDSIPSMCKHMYI